MRSISRTSSWPTCASASIAAWGVGAAVSNILAGWIVVVAGYPAGFISLGIVAGAGLAL
jgi:hypothetical protein